MASGAFLSEKGFYYILLNYLQKSKNVFQKGGVRYLHGALPLSSHALLLSSHTLQLFFTCKHRVAKLNFRCTFIYFHIYIYIYIYIFAVFGKSFPFIKDYMTYTHFLSQTRASHYWDNHISLGISSPHLRMPRHKHR